jgi:8-amino-7-oxononanoate synthase
MTLESDAWSQWVDASLEALDDDDLLRDLQSLAPRDAVHVGAVDDDGSALDLTLYSTNDYLGLSHHSRVREAVAATADSTGMGPRGSPLICGYTTEHEALEAELADLEGTEATLLAPTGFSVNLAVATSLASPETAIFSDELNHASIIDGCRLAKRNGATLEVYDHADPDDLAAKLEASDAERKVIVTDSVFSMEGDLAPLPELVELKRDHDALLIVDEAHGTLVFGERGAGASEALGVNDAIDVNVGTLSKAFGALGGFVSTSQRLKRWILNRGRSYIYSTAPPLPVVQACRASLEVVRDETEIRERMWRHVDRLGSALDRELESPIVPVVFGDEETALRASQHLFERGIHATAIRPPTVPEGTSRIRFTLSAAHTDEDIDELLDALGELDVV